MTTDQYIYGFELIDPIRLHVDKAKKLEVYSSTKDKEEILLATYQFNEFGKIDSCKKQRSSGGWTAYPPKDNSKDGHKEKIALSNSIEKSKEIIIDSYTYSQLGNLLKIETHNTKQKRITCTQNCAYEKGRLVSIRSDKKKTEIERDLQGQILSIKHTVDALLNMTQTIGYKFLRNDKNSITSRDWEFFINRDDPIIAKENFNYNENNQITKSELTHSDEESIDFVHTYFEYVNQNSNLISSIKTYENDEWSGTTEYKYDSQQRIIKRIINHNNLNKGKAVITKYLWT